MSQPQDFKTDDGERLTVIFDPMSDNSNKHITEAEYNKFQASVLQLSDDDWQIAKSLMLGGASGLDPHQETDFHIRTRALGLYVDHHQHQRIAQHLEREGMSREHSPKYMLDVEGRAWDPSKIEAIEKHIKANIKNDPLLPFVAATNKYDDLPTELKDNLAAAGIVKNKDNIGAHYPAIHTAAKNVLGVDA